ncbi:exported hypothetical protein [uncultured Paludibacter sp.]|nr:exported hypothetical protein [uncultured Paludibacter sp.]
MKRILLITTTFICFSMFASAQKSTIIKDILKNTAVEKVGYMQRLIKFSDENAKKLEKIEYQFLLDVQKAENCCMCNSAKKVEKLKLKKNEAIQKILPRDEYLKYNAIEKERIKKQSLQVQNKE